MRASRPPPYPNPYRDGMNKNATATILLAGMMSACAASDKDTLPTTVDAPLVVPVKGTYQTFPDSEKIILTVDASSLPWNPDRLKKSEYAAIIFNGEASPGRICPHINSNNRQRHVSASSLHAINIETTATNDEIKAVSDSGCLITKRVTYRSIRWIPEPLAQKP